MLRYIMIIYQDNRNTVFILDDIYKTATNNLYFVAVFLFYLKI